MIPATLAQHLDMIGVLPRQPKPKPAPTGPIRIVRGEPDF